MDKIITSQKADRIEVRKVLFSERQVDTSICWYIFMAYAWLKNVIHGIYIYICVIYCNVYYSLIAFIIHDSLMMIGWESKKENTSLLATTGQKNVSSCIKTAICYHNGSSEKAESYPGGIQWHIQSYLPIAFWDPSVSM